MDHDGQEGDHNQEENPDNNPDNPDNPDDIDPIEDEEEDEDQKDGEARRIRVKALATNSQHLKELFAESADIRKLATQRDVRRFIWRKFWDRLFQEPEYTERYRNAMLEKERNHGKKHKDKEKDKGAKEKKHELDPRELEWQTRKKEISVPVAQLPPQLEEFYGSLWERHHENKYILENIGEEAYIEALTYLDKETSNYQRVHPLMFVCLKQLTGVDVYWDGMVEANPRKDPHGVLWRELKPNASKSKFGTLRSVPFPFCAVFRYDDCDDYVLFSVLPSVNGIRRDANTAETQLQEFVEVNSREEILLMREQRTKLRSLDGQDISIQVGTKDHKRRRLIDATFHMVYREAIDKNGDLWRNPDTKEIITLVPGFEFEVKTVPQTRSEARCLAFVCGEPETGVHPDHYLAQQKNKDKKEKKEDKDKNDEDDFEDEYDVGPKTLDPHSYRVSREKFPDGMFRAVYNATDAGLPDLVNKDNIHQIYFEYVQKLYNNYRLHMMDVFDRKRKTLSYEFGLFIYSNDMIKREALQATIKRYEGENSPLLHDIIGHGKHVDKLTALYDKLREFDKDLKVCFWYLFWHAVEWNNRNRERFEEHIQRQLDPTEPGSIVSNILEKDNLLKVLEKYGVTPADGKDGAIQRELIDKLYEKMESAVLLVPDTTRKPKQETTEAPKSEPPPTARTYAKYKKHKEARGETPAPISQVTQSMAQFTKEETEELAALSRQASVEGQPEVVAKPIPQRGACSRLCENTCVIQ